MRLIDIDKIKPSDFPSVDMDGSDVVRALASFPTIDPDLLTKYCPNCGAKMDNKICFYKGE